MNILERIDLAIDRIVLAYAEMRISAEDADVDIVLIDAKEEIENLRTILVEKEKEALAYEQITKSLERIITLLREIERKL